jgi:SAM-dependent methyltransferase
MAEADRERWNQRYRAEAYDFTPAAWLHELEPRLREQASRCQAEAPEPQHGPLDPRGPDLKVVEQQRRPRALDLACGGGRNALYLAELGYVVDAWDVSDVGLAYLDDERARRAALGRSLSVRTRRVDLEQTPLPTATYDLVLDAHYLERALWASMRTALRPGGLLIINTFLWTPDGALSRRLSNPAYALQPGELKAAFADLEILELIEDPYTEQAQLVAGARTPP